MLNNFTIPILCIDIYTKLKHCVLLKLCALTSLDLWKCTPKDIATPKARNSENNNFWNLHKSEIYPLICRSRQFMKTLSNCILIRNRRVLVEIFEVKGEGATVLTCNLINQAIIWIDFIFRKVQEGREVLRFY